MTTYHKRSIRRRFCNWIDDCSFWYDRNHEGLISGFVFGVLCVVLVTELILEV